MAKMSKTQRTAILDFHNGVTSKRHSLIAGSRTIAALVRNGWASNPFAGRAAYVTTAGLIAAGVDMDAIHAEALEMGEIRTEWYAEVDAEDAARKAAQVEQAHTEALRENDRRDVDADLAGITVEQLGVKVDTSLHPDDRAKNLQSRLGHTNYINDAINVQPEDICATVETADKALEDYYRRPHMVRAREIGEAERARARGCFHPLSCRACDTAGRACGAHAAGGAGHERCSGA